MKRHVNLCDPQLEKLDVDRMQIRKGTIFINCDAFCNHFGRRPSWLLPDGWIWPVESAKGTQKSTNIWKTNRKIRSIMFPESKQHKRNHNNDKTICFWTSSWSRWFLYFSHPVMFLYLLCGFRPSAKAVSTVGPRYTSCEWGDQQCEKLEVGPNTYNEIGAAHLRQLFQINSFRCFFRPSAWHQDRSKMEPIWPRRLARSTRKLTQI